MGFPWTPGTSEQRSMRRLYRNYIRGCERRNIYWNLTQEQFHKLTSAPCAYCDRLPGSKVRSYTYNGIDRVDNSKGYIVTNSVTCCKECNFIKNNSLLSFEEMRCMAQALKDYRKSKGVTHVMATPPKKLSQWSDIPGGNDPGA